METYLAALHSPIAAYAWLIACLAACWILSRDEKLTQWPAVLRRKRFWLCAIVLLAGPLVWSAPAVI